MGREYKVFKQKKNPLAGGTVDFHLTGDLHEGMTIRKKGKDIFEIYSTDNKFKALADKYGYEEFTLSENEWHEFEPEILNIVIEQVLNKTYEML